MLFSYTELFNYLAIPIKIVLLKIIKMPPTLANHFQKTPARMIIVLVSLQMLRQMSDPSA